MPAQQPGKSRQDYETPSEFLRAVVRRFGPIRYDVACTKENSKGQHFLGDNTLTLDWSRFDGNIWCNPPFADIGTWAKKFSDECFARPAFSFLLVPASIGTDWFAKHVKDRAFVLGIAPRLTFVGCSDPYPKGLMTAVYGFSMRGFDTWRWQ